MAVSLSSSSGRWGIAQNAEINVTPFVDVMLVLLVIFMVALPVATVSVKVDLPQAGGGQDQFLPVIVSLTLDGHVYVGDSRTTLDGLAVAVAGVSSGTAQRIYIRADKGVSYGALMAAMDRLRASGFDKVGLMADAE